ncbi:MAG: TolC family protein, partial [Anaerolineae bacterium]|nr:TolC family protein [Anaerolineae bacterium]
QDARDLELSRNVDNWAVGVEVEVDVFSGFRTSARVAAAEERVREAREGVRRLVLEVEQEVRTAFAALEEARERVRVTEAAKAQAEEALRLVREQYQAGTVPVTRTRRSHY